MFPNLSLLATALQEPIYETHGPVYDVTRTAIFAERCPTPCRCRPDSILKTL
jgi:hypothetical protein